MVSNQKEIALFVIVADCVPIIFADIESQVIGVAHSGWKGTVLNISTKVVEVMITQFNCKVENINIWLGSCIKECCYEVNDDVINKFKNNSYSVYIKREEKLYLNLHNTIFNELISNGILENNIEVDNICVSCHNRMYYSYRGDGGNTGRFVAGIWLLKD